MKSWPDRSRRKPSMLARWLNFTARAVLALILGMASYLVVLVLNFYEDPVALIAQSILSLGFSAILLTLAGFVGLIARIPPLWRAWSANPRIAFETLLTGLLLWAASIVGFMVLHPTFPTPDILPWLRLCLMVWVLGTFLIMFVIVNAPVSRTDALARTSPKLLLDEL